MSLKLKRIDDPNPQTVELNVTLSPDAQRRLERATTEGMHKLLQVSINGIQVSSAMVGSVVRGPGLRIGMPREVARNLVPTLLEPLTP